MDDQLIRQSVFQYLSAITDGGDRPVTWKQLQAFNVGGRRITIAGQRGIWFWKGAQVPISIATAPPDPSRPAPYDDSITDDGLLRYRYFGTDRNHRDNVGLREARHSGTPLVYLKGIRKGLYHASWPVYVIDDHPADLAVTVMLGDPGVIRPDLDPSTVSAAERRYYATLTRRRLHQSEFRDRVLQAYASKCSMCQLRHVELLDAAHIVPDSDGGPPVVQNGLSLCKIHHAAFDHHIIGGRPDNFLIQVNQDVLEEEDGPMLRHGIQDMHGNSLVLPSKVSSRPHADYLERRFEAFSSR